MSWVEIITSVEIGLIYGIVALGIYITFRIIDFPDLTCDGSFVSGAAACAVALKLGINPIFALTCAFLVGALGGLITSILYIYCRLTNLLSGILTAFMLYSLNLKLMGGVPNIALMNEITIFSWGNPLLIVLGIALVIWGLCSAFFLTDFGLGLRSLGKNSVLGEAYGIRTSLFTFIALILSNSLIGLGGGLFCQHQGFADITQGIGTIIVGLAAIMVGEKLVPIKSMWCVPIACFLGSIIYRLAIAFALHSEWIGLQSSDLNLVTGLLVIGIMWFPRVHFAREKIC